MPEPFVCSVDAVCVDEGVAGRCELSVSHCSYPASDCESGRRYGPFASEFAAECTPPPVEVDAVFAMCLGETKPLTGADSCESHNGMEHLDIDFEDSDTEEEVRNAAFINFSIPADRQRPGPTRMTLTLTVASEATAGSDSSGRVWQVESFTRESLAGMEPAQVPPMLGDAQRDVVPGQAVAWSFELDLSDVGDTLSLAVFPSSSDNVRYWSLVGDVPPKLLIE